jgi:hypothetical protein
MEECENIAMISLRLALPLCLLLAADAAAQSPVHETEPPVQVLVLGTYHFDNPGLDVVKGDVADVLAPAKQVEIRQVVDALARFRPTRIAVEARPAQSARLDSLYAAYRAGRHALAATEVQQLGFRLAERLGHSRVYPIDQPGDFPFGAVMEYAQKHDTATAGWIQRTMAEIGAEQNRRQQLTIAEILRLENDPALIRQGHAHYLTLGRVGAGDTWVGADLVAGWYARNIRIFAALQQIAEPGDRVLVIFGAGHAAILRELIAGDPGLELIEANDYLP